MAKFKYTAKLTQRIYGTKSHAAVLEIFLNIKIVTTMAAHKSTITANALPTDWAPKNIGDQIAFKTSWATKSQIALPFSLESLFHTNHSAIPISRYKIVQTGPNIQAGGLSAGFTIPAYQVGMDGTVNSEPATPASPETAMAITSLERLFSRIL